MSAKDGLLSQRAIHARTASSKRHDVERLGVNPEISPHFLRWLGAIKARPAVKRGLDVLKGALAKARAAGRTAKKLLFGSAPT